MKRIPHLRTAKGVYPPAKIPIDQVPIDQVHGEGEAAKTIPSGGVIDRQRRAPPNHTVMLPVAMPACQVSLQVSTILSVFEVKVFEVKVFEATVFEVKVLEATVFEVTVFEVKGFEVKKRGKNMCEVNVSILLRHSPHFRFSLTWRSKNALTTFLLLPSWHRSFSLHRLRYRLKLLPILLIERRESVFFTAWTKFVGRIPFM
jgi:hypothetical protein